jgi:hypothetical protein
MKSKGWTNSYLFISDLLLVMLVISKTLHDGNDKLHLPAWGGMLWNIVNGNVVILYIYGWRLGWGSLHVPHRWGTSKIYFQPLRLN